MFSINMGNLCRVTLR